MNISYSDIAAFSRCRFLYQATKIKKWPEPDTAPKVLGSLVHLGLAAHLLGNAPILAINDAWSNLDPNRGIGPHELRALAQTAVSIVDRAVDFLADKWRTRHIIIGDKTLPLVEYGVYTFGDVLLPQGTLDGSRVFRHERIEVNGIVDWVAVEQSTGQTWLFDFKTRNTLEADGTDDYNLQMAMYQYILQDMGIPVVGSICMQIRTVVPQAPKLNKDGSMSRTDIVTDWPTYKAELELHGLNPLEYVDMQLKLEQKRFFHLTKTYRNQLTLANLWQNVVLKSAKEMFEVQLATLLEADYQAPRSLSSMCKICSVAERCLNQLHGIEDTIEIILEE